MKALSSVATLWFCLACRVTPGGDANPQASPAQAALATTRSTTREQDGQLGARLPSQALDELDGRRPLPLLAMMAQHQKENMREHLEVVQEVVAAAARNDFEKVAAAAKRMGFSETMARMCEHMGAAAPGFTAQTLRFHHAADEIAVAATKRNSAEVLTALSKTLSECTSCHATYKQQVVDRLPE